MDNILIMRMTERHLKFVQGLARYGQIFTGIWAKIEEDETGSGFGTPISVYIFAIL